MFQKNKAVFLDRDGVLNELVLRHGKNQAPYSLEELKLTPTALESCQLLKQASFLLVVVTNQPDVARGWVGKESVEIINDRILQLLPIDRIEVCFHDNSDQCECRKPRPGMLLKAAKDFNIDLSQSYMIGDRYSDVAAGVAAGCRTILVGPGDERAAYPDPHHQVQSLLDGVRIILKQN